MGRLDPQDVDVRGAVAILGLTGAGKNTVVDALQVVITGADSRHCDLNKSTGGRNARSICDHRLGADDYISPGRPIRGAAEKLIALVFRDRVSGEPVTIGLLLFADEADARHAVRRRFVAPGLALSIAERGRGATGRPPVHPRPRSTPGTGEAALPGRPVPLTATSYVDHHLVATRRRSATPDARQVLRNFRKSIAFEPIDDPKSFVREHILERDDVDVDALKGSIERYRYLKQ